jgi:hypothetical protein
MRILDIENYFKSEDTLDQVLEECKGEFERIDYWAGKMKSNITDNPAEAKSSLNELTGIYMTLKTVLAIAETEKKNKEIREYDRLRIEAGKSGKKFVSASSEKQASASVTSYRRVRNIIEAYLEASNKAISTLQSILKWLVEEAKLEGRTEK